MIQHLSSEQISQCVVGNASPDISAHLDQCTACAAQLALLTESLGMFRSAMRETAGQLGDRQRVLVVPRRRVAVLWLTATAALISLTALPVYKVEQNRQRAEMAKQDSELMDQVNADLSEEVAAPMKPLQKMVSWGSGSQSPREKRNY